MNKIQLLSLIDDYLADIKVGVNAFEKQYGSTDLITACQQGLIPKQGQLTNKIHYELHGIGCCFYINDKEVDFDYGVDRRYDGFDLWRLQQYLPHAGQHFENITEQDLVEPFE